MSHSQIIPAERFNSRLQAARYYRDQLRWAVHPLHGPKDPQVGEKERGKKPLLKDYKTRTVNDCTEAILTRYFVESSDANIGIVVQAPQIVIDLDSKQDGGESVRAWLAQQPQLQTAPRERTAGGAHLHYRCPDLPAITKNGKPHGAALVAKLNDQVTAELYFQGLNVVVAPSVHAKGHTYTWEVTGQITNITWAELQRSFGFCLPDDDSDRGRRKGRKDGEWFERFRGDLGTLDLAALFGSRGLLGDLLNAGEGKIAVHCPWRHEHGNADEEWRTNDSSTAIFTEPQPPLVYPGFLCSHAHCASRGLEQVLEWFEQRQPGCVNKYCKRMRVWEEGQTSPDGRPRVVLPGEHRPHSAFASDLARIIGPKKIWAVRGDSVVALRIKQSSELVKCQTFHHLTPAEVCTAIEEHVEVGGLRRDSQRASVFVPYSMCESTARLLISAPQFKKGLPEILRLLNFQIPVIYQDQLVLPELGHDERFSTYTALNAPKVIPVTVEQAKTLLDLIHQDFPFDSEQSRVHAIARLLTPASRGIMGWTARVPFWMFMANRERAGKDFLAAITGLVYDGFPNDQAPIEPRHSEETRKRITAALIDGLARMHFANCRGHLADTALEQAITSSVWSDRVLSMNKTVTLPNELEFSLSGNVGLTYTADLAYRSRRIGLFFGEENPNLRRFRRPDLHSWVLQHRSEILSSLIALIRHWYEAGRPDGPTPYASYQEWARVVGGIMHAASLGDPCLPDMSAAPLGGDEETAHMKLLFQQGHEKWGCARVAIPDIIQLIQEEEADQLFQWLDLSDRGGRTTFGLMLRRFAGRTLGGIVLRLHDADKKRKTFSFEPVDGASPPAPPPTELKSPKDAPETVPTAPAGGNVGNLGNLFIPMADGEDHNQRTGSGGNDDDTSGRDLKKVPNVPKVPTPPAQTAPRLITNRSELTAIAELWRSATPGTAIALDIETYGQRRADALDPFHGEIRLLTLQPTGAQPVLLDLKALGYDLGPLKPVLEAAEVVCHNAGFDLLWLRTKCGLRVSRVFCSLTASKLLTNGSNEKNDLGECLRRYLNIDLAKDQAKSNWAAPGLSPDQLRYAVEDVLHLHDLKAALDTALRQADLTRVAELEMTLLPVVVDMVHRGIAVDRLKMGVLQDKAFTEAATLKDQLLATVGDPKFNPNSPPQVLRAFAKFGVKLTDTQEETLADCPHPLAAQLLEYRHATKRAEQPKRFLAATDTHSRIHAQFNPLGAETGRFSCSRPNIQNVARGELRQGFVAAPGNVLVIADYSQIELRIGAVISGEARMLKAYQEGQDLHRQTASLILGKPLDAVTKEDRQLGKAVNFGMLYGQSAKGLVRTAKGTYGVELSLAQAGEFSRKFFVAYSNIEQWHRRSRNKSRTGAQEIRTVTGRRRFLPHGTDSKTAWDRFTCLVNTVVQGSGADGLKCAMIQVARNLPEAAHLVNTIHDELIVETPQALAEQVKTTVHDCMVQEMAKLFPQVPIEVEVKVAANWGEK